MDELYEKAINFLLEYASLNIKYRVKKEILKIPADSGDMMKLQ